MFVIALLALGQQGLRTTRGGVDRTRALYAAEAGLARAIAEMERDPTWSDGFSDQSMPGGTATYSASFATSAPDAGKDESFNNLLGTTSVDSYHGPLTVPAHSALLMVTGRSGTATRTVEALVVTGADVSVTDALTATGPIQLGGEVAVDGRKSLVDPAPRLANLHHNSDQDGLGVVYNGGAAPWEQITVTGEVTSSSSDSPGTVFDFNTPYSPPDTKTRVPLKDLPRPNIVAMLDDHSGLSNVPIPTSPGAFSLSGDNYYSGDVAVNGDLELKNGARLYVRGNLLVNGSVRGKGTLVVGGTSEFYGDAEVSGLQSEYIALLSRGSVTLKGFQGETYMLALTAGDPTAAEHWEDLSFGLKGITDSIGPEAQKSAVDFKNAIAAGTEMDEVIDRYQALVAHNPLGIVFHGETDPIMDGPRARHWDNSAYFRDLIGGGPALSTENFLHERFQTLDDWFRQGHMMRGQVPATGRWGFQQLEFYTDRDPVHDGGLFDSIQSIQLDFVHFTPETEVYFLDAMAAAQAFDFDRLGNANFKGLIYTSGAFVGLDDVTVQGTVIINGDPDVPPLVHAGITYEPGQVGLFGHSRLTRVDEFFDDGVHNLVGAGTLDIKRWTNR